MATIVISNLSSSPVFLREFYANLGPAGQKNVKVGPTDTLTTVKPAGTLGNMDGLMQLLAAGTVSVSVTPDAGEAGSALLVPPQSVGQEDLVKTADTTASNTFSSAVPFIIKVPLVAADTSETVYAADALPYKMRVIDAVAFLSTAGSGSIAVNSKADGSGTALAAPITCAAGLVRPSSSSWTASVVTPLTTGSGFFVTKPAATVGELWITVRKEV
jgi:hypothetical protein